MKYFSCLFAHLVAFLVFPCIQLGAVPSALAAPSVYDLPSSEVAIQPRKYEMLNSISFSAGYSPIDSFNKAFTLSGGYRYSWKNYFFLEGLVVYFANRPTSLESDLKNLNIDVRNVGLGGVLDYPRQAFLLGLHYAPLYSKSLLFNSTLVYSETGLYLGVGSLNFNQIGFKQTLVPGLSTRMYLNRDWAVTGYFRDFFYSDTSRGIVSIFDFGIGIEMRMGG